MMLPTSSGDYRITSRSTGSFWALTAGRDGASSVNNYMYTGATDQKWVFETIANKSTPFNAFSSFSIGDDNMSGYNHFNNYLEGRTLNSKRYYPLVKFNYTLGKISKTSLIESLTCSDVAFIDSHATATGIWMKDNTGTQYDTIRLASDIGTNFKTGSTTITNTPFNKKTKWIIIQACSQLNYTDGGTADDNSALQWAKALLGDGVRMHGVLGYYGSGPEGDIAGSKLEIFMASQINLSSRPNMITGWKLANESLSGSSSWAGICHRANLDDKLYWGWTANTAKGSAYTIDRYSYKNGTQKPLPVSTAKISPNSDSTMNLLLENENIANQKFTLESKAFTSTQLQKIRNTLNSDNLNISLDGKLTYLDSLASPTEATSTLEWTEEQAIRQAKEYLDTLGLLPQNNYLVKTSTTVREELDVFNETVSSAQTVGWTIRFYQTQNGVPVVSSEDNGILMTISEKGLHSLQYNWGNIVPVSQTKGLNSDCETLLSKNEAIKKYCNKVSVENVDVHRNVCYRQVYVYQHDALIPAWVFGAEDAFFEPTYINALTGETLHIN